MKKRIIMLLSFVLLLAGCAKDAPPNGSDGTGDNGGCFSFSSDGAWDSGPFSIRPVSMADVSHEAQPRPSDLAP